MAQLTADTAPFESFLVLPCQKEFTEFAQFEVGGLEQGNQLCGTEIVASRGEQQAGNFFCMFGDLVSQPTFVQLSRR